MNPAPMRQARSPNGDALAACAALAGVGVLIPGMAGLGEALWPGAATVAAASVASVTAAPFFFEAMAVRPGRRWLSAEERGGALFLLGLLVAGLANLSKVPALCAGCALAQLL